MLFPAPLRELREIAGDDVQILYDAAHVFGLILGGSFQDPLLEGADMIASSTNKTLGAPCHGVVMWSKEAEEKYEYKRLVADALVPLFTSNHHGHHVAGLAVTLAEMRTYGKEYATQVIRNAQALGRALHEDEELPVVASECGYTQSHEVLLDTGTDDSSQAMRDLEAANIITSRCPIPTADCASDSGLRLGTNEMTRMGMKESEMKRIAGHISDVLRKRKAPEEVKKEVVTFRNEFQEQQFCF